MFAGLTIRNGKVTGPGGGIRVGNADLVVRDCAVTGNRASATGGGISNGSIPGTGNVTLVRTTIGRNVTGAGGGGICVTGSSTLAVRGSTVRRNIAAFDGGGIAADTATLTDCTVSGNSAATYGGGLSTPAHGHADQLHRQRQLRQLRRRRHLPTPRHGDADQLHRQRQLRQHDGGGLASSRRHGHADQLHRQRQLRRRTGGGLYNLDGTATLTNCTVSGNSAAATAAACTATTARPR